MQPASSAFTSLTPNPARYPHARETPVQGPQPQQLGAPSAGERRWEEECPGEARMFSEAETHGHWEPAATSPDTPQRVGALGGAQAAAGVTAPVPVALSHLSGGRAGGSGRRGNPRHRERFSSRRLLWDPRTVPRSSSRPSAPSAAKPSPQSRERGAAAPPPSALPLRAGHAPSRRPSSPPLPLSPSRSLPTASGPALLTC